MAQRSIARRLFLSAAVWIIFILVAAGVFLSAYYSSNAERAFDERLGVYLRALVADVAMEGDAQNVDPGGLADPQFELVLSGWYWQITRLDTEKPIIRASRSLFAGRLPKLSDAGVHADIGGARASYAIGPDDRRLRIVERVLSVGDSGLYLVQVAATTEEIDAAVARFEMALAIVFAFLAVGLLAVTGFQVSFGLAPLRQLGAAVAGVRRGENERIEGAYPREIADLSDELNLLIGANRDVVERARTQVGNLAHALKTPLSVILNEAGDDQGLLADKVREQAVVMRDQVNYYLDRARAAARAGAIGSTTDVTPTLDGLVRTFKKIHRSVNLNIAADSRQNLRFLGEKQDFEEMIGNLLDNACKWASQNVLLCVSLEPGVAGRCFLKIVIDDDGPGLPEDLRQEAVRRGRRLDETKPGSGLGLSIVSDLAGAYGGSLVLGASPQHGLSATIRLPGL